MSYSTSRTTRTTYSSGGPGGRTSTTTTTYGDGRRNVTHSGDGSSGGGHAPRAPRGNYIPSARSTQKPTRRVAAGERGFSGTQVLSNILNEARQSGQLWEDTEFPPDNRSLFFSKQPPRPFTWKRPHEIASNPKLLVGGASRFDVKQGALGDCWLLAAVASLSLHPQLLARVVPQDQSFEKSQGYCGVFHFQFWQFGHWVDVIVDDLLPTYDGKLVFLHSAENNEFWSALLEKAYAKLVGSYEALKGGSTSEAMEDFTGGITEFFDFTKEYPANLFQIMMKADQRSSLMACSIEAKPNVTEARLSNGLIMGHAYSVTGVKKVSVRGGDVELVRIRNPWGNEAEWKGAWSDSSNEWRAVPDSEKKRIGLTYDDDGEFWMAFSDFKATGGFQRLEVCHLGPDSAVACGKDGQPKRRWEASMEESNWSKNKTAGGCRNFIATFHMNPQFRVKVEDPDEDDDDNSGTLIIGLMQKGRRKKREEGLDMLTIGYAIYKLSRGKTGTLDRKYFEYNASAAKSPQFINLREVCGRHKLAPGEYVIVPSTFNKDEEADFIVRVFSEHPCPSGEMDEETSIQDIEPQKEDSPQERAQSNQLHKAFESIAGEDMEIDCYELLDILNAAFKREFAFDGFSIETCRSMVALMDVDQSGKLGFDEFQRLWNDLRVWKSAFKKHDTDKSGAFNSSELRDCFRAIGFTLSNATFKSIVLRYAQKDGTVQFDDFILAAVRLKTIYDTYSAMPKQGNKISFDLDYFIRTCIYT